MNSCKICNNETKECFNGLILKKYDETYYRCVNCGFIQTDLPHWLDEAYSNAITKQDIGLVHRNLSFAPIVSCIISFIFNRKGKYIDFGGGYGLLTRIMRDRGYDYYRYDTYCKNLFVEDFDRVSPASPEYELLTAFELFEHLVDPVEELKGMLKWSSNILFSTEIQKSDLKSSEDWWYIMPETGQHIAFYTIKSLRLLGEKFNLNFYTNGVNLHLFTKIKINPIVFKLSTTHLSAKFLHLFASKNESLLMQDYHLSKI